MKTLFVLLALSLPAWATFTSVQDPSTASGACYPVDPGGTCVITVPSTGSGHLLYLTTKNFFATPGLVTPTNGEGCAHWVQVPFFQNNATDGGVYTDWYCPKSSSGTTSITLTLTGSAGSNAVTGVMWEQSYTGTNVALDYYCASSTATVTASPVPGCTIPFINGTNDSLLGYIGADTSGQTVTAVNGTGWSNTLVSGIAYPSKLNTTTLTPPTGTTSASTAFTSIIVAFTDSVASANMIGAIGDSDTFGYLTVPFTNPCVNMAAVLTAARQVPYACVVFGIIGSKSGDWVSGSTNLNNAIGAFTDSGVGRVMITLGGGDASDANMVSSGTFQTNIQSAISGLETGGFNDIFLNYEPYIVGGTGFTQPGLDTLMQAYQTTYPVIRAADITKVFINDTTCWNYLKNNQSLISGDGIHMTNAGSTYCGQLWAKALLQVAAGNTARRRSP